MGWFLLRYGYGSLGMTMAYGQWVGEHLAAWEELLLFPKISLSWPQCAMGFRQAVATALAP